MTNALQNDIVIEQIRISIVSSWIHGYTDDAWACGCFKNSANKRINKQVRAFLELR